MIKINVYVANKCPTCKRVMATLQSYSDSNPEIKVVIMNIANSCCPVSIVPAVFLNDELYCYGEVDKEKLNLTINKLGKFNSNK